MRTKIALVLILALCGGLVLPEILVWKYGKALAHHLEVPDPSVYQASIRHFHRGCVLVAGEDTLSDKSVFSEKKEGNVVTKTYTNVEVKRRNPYPRSVWIESVDFDVVDTPYYIHQYYKGQEINPFAMYDGRTNYVYWDANRDGHWDGVGKPGMGAIGNGACDTLKSIYLGKLRSVRKDRPVRK